MELVHRIAIELANRRFILRRFGVTVSTCTVLECYAVLRFYYWDYRYDSSTQERVLHVSQVMVLVSPVDHK